MPDEISNVPALLSISAVRSPDLRWLALLTLESTYLADAQLGTLCKIDLGMVGEVPRRAFAAKWSPDGQWLAMQTTAARPGELFPFMNETLLNMNTGGLQYAPVDQDVFEAEWAADSRRLLLLLDASKQRGVPGSSLALLDIVTNKVEPILAGWYFASGGSLGLQMAWSNDGQGIAISCPLDSGDGILVEGRMCVINVHAEQ